MNLAGRFYELQQVDLEIQSKHQTLNEIENNLQDDKDLLAVRSKLDVQKQQLAEAKRKQKEIEWELEDLQGKVKRTSDKLYGGKIKNPKELMNLEDETKSLKSRIGRKEDELLEIMAQAEDMEAEVKASVEKSQELQQEWQQRQDILNRRKVEIEVELSKIQGTREELVQSLDPENMGLYEQLRVTKGQAVAKVEQGKCQGCHIALPTNQWQKVKAGNLVQCSNCGKVLYVE